jgi:ABC-2 type transport system ATP-binding protein
MSQAAIDLACVRKSYRGRVHALREVALRVEAGEIFGLLGPNGAGKSTLVKILLTVVRPTEARGTLLGRPVGDKASLACVGYLPEQHRLPPYLTARQAVEFSGALSGVRRPQRRRRAAELLDRVGLGNWKDRRVSSFSKGMRQRAGLAAALVNNPQLVFLDEPTDGVDPVGRKEIRDLLVTMRSEGRTVFLNSHLLSEAEQVCDRVAILLQGRVVTQGRLTDLQREGARQRLTVRWFQDPPAVPGQSGMSSPDPADPMLCVHDIPSLDPAAAQPAIDAARRAGATIVSLVPERQGLEALFMKAVTDPLTGQPLPPGAAS